MLQDEKPSLEELVLKHRNVDYDPVKAHQYYMLNRELKPKTSMTKDEAKDVKDTRALAYKNASSEDKKLFSIPNKQWTKPQSDRMIRLFNKASEAVAQNKRIKKAPKKSDTIQQFSPTLSRIMRDGQGMINAGRSFLKQMFG